MATSNSTPPEGGLFHPSDLISSYSRAQAIADGVLVDVTETAKEAGFRIPVALTRAAWAECVAWSEADTKRQVPQDEAGRLWDVLWMAHNGIRSLLSKSIVLNPIKFVLYRVPRGGRATRPQKTLLKAVFGHGDKGEPVLTIMLPEED